jgi:hypothetical protein
VIAAVSACGALFVAAAPASAANRFAEVGGDGPEPCLVTNPCPIETAINSASTATSDDVTLLGGLPPAPYVTSTPLVVPSNVTVHGDVAERAVIEASGDGSQPGIKLNTGSVLRDVVVNFDGPNLPAIQLVGGGALERVTAHATGPTSAGGCGTLDGGTMVIRDSVCWHDGPSSTNTVGGITARNGTAVNQTLNLRNVTAIASDNGYAGIAAFRVDGGGLTINATNVIAFSGTGTDVAYLNGFTPTAINFDHSNYDTEADPNNVITSPGTGSPNFNQTTPPVFVNRIGGDFHQLPTSTGTIDLGAAELIGELDFDGQPRTIGTAPDIGADELQHQTTTAVACTPASLTLGAGSSTCTATVTDIATDPITPTFEVVLSSNGSGTFGPGECNLAEVSIGVASCQRTYTPSAVGSGSHQITASYVGDEEHDPSQGSTTVGVAAPAGTSPIAGLPPSFNLKAAIKKCKKKFPKGPKRKKCIKRAKRRAGL